MGLPLFLSPETANTGDEVSDLISDALVLVTDAQNDSRQAQIYPGVDFSRRLLEAQSRLQAAQRERRREQRRGRSGSGAGEEREISVETVRPRSRDSIPSLIDEELDDSSANNSEDVSITLESPTLLRERHDRNQRIMQEGSLVTSWPSLTWLARPIFPMRSQAEPTINVQQFDSNNVTVRNPGSSIEQSPADAIVGLNANTNIEDGQHTQEQHLSNREWFAYEMTFMINRFSPRGLRERGDGEPSQTTDILEEDRGILSQIGDSAIRPLSQGSVFESLETSAAFVSRVPSLLEENPIEVIPGSWRANSNSGAGDQTSIPTRRDVQSASRERVVMWSNPRGGTRRIGPEAWWRPRSATPSPTINNIPIIPQNSPSLHREDASVRSFEANVGGTLINDSEMDLPSEHNYFNSARAEGLVTQFMADIEIYDRVREREFSRWHGYRRYSPTRESLPSWSRQSRNLRTISPPNIDSGTSSSSATSQTSSLPLGLSESLSTSANPQSPARSRSITRMLYRFCDTVMMRKDEEFYRVGLSPGNRYPCIEEAFLMLLLIDNRMGWREDRMRFEERDINQTNAEMRFSLVLRDPVEEPGPETAEDLEHFLTQLRRLNVMGDGRYMELILIAEEDGMNQQEATAFVAAWMDFQPILRQYAHMNLVQEDPFRLSDGFKIFWTALRRGWGRWRPSTRMINGIVIRILTISPILAHAGTLQFDRNEVELSRHLREVNFPLAEKMWISQLFATATGVQ